MYLTQKIIRAGDLSQPLADGPHPPPNPSLAYTPRFHDPDPTASNPESGSSSVPNHAGAKKDARRREEARAAYLGRGADDGSDRGQGWQEVHGIAWEDLEDFRRKYGPEREESSSPVSSAASEKESRRMSGSRGSDRRQERPRASPKPKTERY